MATAIDQLMNTRWYAPAARGYRQYLEAHRRLNCQGLSMSFEDYARDILQMPDRARDEMFKQPDAKELELACLQKQPSTAYGQYVSPTQKEQILGLSGKKPKKGKS